MPKRGPGLTDQEAAVVQALLAANERSQDVHALINTGRTPTVNFGRISVVRKTKVKPATEDEVARFKFDKSLLDLRTGLSPFQDERLFKAREAMLLAVHLFNSTLIRFKVETFPVIANIAWTYLLHEFYEQKGDSVVKKDGHSLVLSEMIERSDCPLSTATKDNLRALKIVRDAVEHTLLDSFGESLYLLFQANCLNFENAIRKLFGDKLSLGNELSFALQFSKLSIAQATAVQSYDLSPSIAAIDARINAEFSAEKQADVEFKFKVIYELEKSAKADAHFKFKNAAESGGADLQNILVQKVSSDEEWPNKPTDIILKVRERTGKPFSSDNHQRAWKKFSARPRNGKANPEVTNKKYCIYNKAHKDYTYSEAWIDHLCAIVSDEPEFDALRTYKTSKS